MDRTEWIALGDLHNYRGRALNSFHGGRRPSMEARGDMYYLTEAGRRRIGV